MFHIILNLEDPFFFLKREANFSQYGKEFSLVLRGMLRLISDPNINIEYRNNMKIT